MATFDFTEKLLSLQDTEYKLFQQKLVPTVSPDAVIGVRIPVLRQLAKDSVKKIPKEDIQSFLEQLPHRYYDENNFHAFLIETIRNFDECLATTERFLPYVDNWATCDSFCPGVFKKEPEKLLPYIPSWLNSAHTYTVRFGINMLLRLFLDGYFKPEYLDWVLQANRNQYYINMEVAWYFSVALVKQYETTLPYVQERRLDLWTHNKTIQKAIESRRLSENQKNFLKTLRYK